MKQRAIIFHGIGRPGRPLEPGEAKYWIAPDLFGLCLDLVASAPAGSVIVTFDDGNLSDIDIGAEGLARFGLSGHFFALAGRIGLPGSLGTSELRELARRGHVIGSHGWGHVDWRQARGATLERELTGARRAIEAASGRTVDSAAIPFGRYDRRVLGALRRAGYRSIWSSDGGDCRGDEVPVPRTSITAEMTEADVRRIILSPMPVTARLRRLAARSVKRLV